MPYTTPKHVFVHMPKTGGTWLGNYLRTTRGQNFRQIGYGHGPLSEISVSAQGDRTVIGIVRNPYDWYMSWFQHCKARGSRHPALKTYGGLNFRDVLWGATHLDQIDPDATFPTVLWDVPSGTDRELKTCGVGLWSWSVRYFFEDFTRVDHLLHTEHLREETILALGESIPEETWPIKNTSKDRPYSHIQDKNRHWTQEMRDWVDSSDRVMAQKLGYLSP